MSAPLSLLDDRHASCDEARRHAIARRVDQGVCAVGDAGIDANHHRPWPAGHREAPLAIDTERVSCGTRTCFGTLALVFPARLNASATTGDANDGTVEEMASGAVGRRAQEILDGKCRPLSARRRGYGHAIAASIPQAYLVSLMPFSP
jgi:hypothetical protein